MLTQVAHIIANMCILCLFVGLSLFWQGSYIYTIRLVLGIFILASMQYHGFVVLELIVVDKHNQIRIRKFNINMKSD
jgi:hypothetical protein